MVDTPLLLPLLLSNHDIEAHPDTNNTATHRFMAGIFVPLQAAGGVPHD
jgi:hypothetical protein